MSQIQKSSRLTRAKQLDAIIDASLPALVEIHKGNYFVELGFKTMQDYLRSKGKSYFQSWQSMEAIKIQESLPDVKIPNEATAREIKKIALPQRRQVVSAALEQSEGKLSAPAIKKAVASLPERKKQPVKLVAPVKLPKDGTGIDIPPEIQEFWNRNEEIKFLIGMIKKVRLTMQEADKSGDRLFCKMDRQGVISRLIMCEQEIESAENFAVCPECNGVFLDKACICKGRGTFSEYWWKTIDENIRKLRPIFKEYK